jgi:RNA polymerase sigma-70 factor (ECF subfamily)
LIARDMSCSLPPRTLSAFEAAGVEVESDADLEQRFDAFVNGYRDRAIRIAWRLLGRDAAAAEDVAQEAFARAYRALGGFRDEAKLSTWFYRILVNEVRRHQRRRALREAWRADDREPDALADPATSGDSARPDPGLRRRIGDAIAALPRGQREAFVLVHLEGLTLSEAASASGRAVGTMKSHLHRALASLRTRLADLAPSGAGSAEERR